MRVARVKYQGAGCYYHLINRVAGTSEDRPFGDVEKQKFVTLLHWLSQLYTIEVISYVVMCNHVHLTIFCPGEPPSLEETARRYEIFHKGQRTLTASAPLCAEIAPRLNDISWFMRDLQQRFTVWFNRSRRTRRRGSLWADRFKSVILDGERALLNAIKYIALNPVRACLVKDPADYHFSSWGVWHGTGRHPFADNFYRHTKRTFGDIANNWDKARLEAELRADMTRTIAAEAGANSDKIHETMEDARQKPPMLLRLDRRVRYWSDGLIIGSKSFVREVAASVYGNDVAKKKRLGRGLLPESDEYLFSFRQLRND